MFFTSSSIIFITFPTFLTFPLEGVETCHPLNLCIQFTSPEISSIFISIAIQHFFDATTLLSIHLVEHIQRRIMHRHGLWPILLLNTREIFKRHMRGRRRRCIWSFMLASASYPVSVSIQRRTRREEITRSRCFSLITSACVESMIVTALKSGTPCKSVSMAFQNCVCSSAERWFQDTSSAFRRLRFRRNRKGSMFLAFPDVEASSLLPCFLDVHRSVSFGRHPSPVSVTLHRHSVVSRRSFLGHAHVESLSSRIITSSSCTHLLELGRACFGG